MGPNYTYVFDFERDFDQEVTKGWFLDNWQTITTYAAGLYIFLIFGGQHYMSSRPRMEIRGALILWNAFLAVFSIMGALRTWTEFLHVLSEHGIHHSLCVSRYHHITVLLYSWYSYSEYTAAARWFITMNYLVHSVMYTYYAFKAAKFRVPRGIAMIITTLQLIQMVVGTLVNFWTYQMKQDGLECQVSDTNIKLSLLMYVSYFVLFARFFHNAYLKPKSSEKAQKRD